MIIKFRAFANMEDANGTKWRVNIYNYDTEKEAEIAAKKFLEKYRNGYNRAVYTGVHKYYIFSKKEWEKQVYKGVSIRDGKTKTWMTNEGSGTTLLFEGVHFEIKN